MRAIRNSLLALVITIMMLVLAEAIMFTLDTAELFQSFFEKLDMLDPNFDLKGGRISIRWDLGEMKLNRKRWGGFTELLQSVIRLPMGSIISMMRRIRTFCKNNCAPSSGLIKLKLLMRAWLVLLQQKTSSDFF